MISEGQRKALALLAEPHSYPPASRYHDNVPWSTRHLYIAVDGTWHITHTGDVDESRKPPGLTNKEVSAMHAAGLIVSSYPNTSAANVSFYITTLGRAALREGGP